MTPLAARLFREGNDTVQRGLAGCQFFECSSLLDLAAEMLAADTEAGCNVYSAFAQLPAPATVIEFVYGGTRFMVACQQEADRVTWDAYAAAPGGKVEFQFSCGFLLGSDVNAPNQWNVESGLRFPLPAGVSLEQGRTEMARGWNGLIEKMLCIINQPGLVDRRGRDTDKRVLRKAGGLPIPRRWHECRIRPGHHGDDDPSSLGEAREHQLHYVRKYFKPSIQKWVEGYWRGNADLGIHLKWYSVTAPAAGRAAA